MTDHLLRFGETDTTTNQAEDEGDDIDDVETGDVCERVERLMMVARPGRRSNVSLTLKVSTL